MKKLTELEKAIRAVGSFMGMMAGPGSDMEGQWIIVKNAAQLVEAELPASDNTTNRAIALLKRFVEVINEHDIGQKTLSLMSDTQEFLEEIAQRH